MCVCIWGGGWVAAELSLTRAAGHNSLCGDCVEGLASRPVDCCVGAAAFALQASPVLAVVASMPLFSGRGSNRKEIRRTENMTVASVMCDLSHMPTPFHLFLFYVILASRTDLKTGNASEFTSPLILAMGS